MRLPVLVLLAVGALAALACGSDGDEGGSVDTSAAPTAAAGSARPSTDDVDGDDPDEGAPTGVTFTWITTMDLDGSGYELVVAGTVGPDHADYTMQVSPFAAAGTSDMIPTIAAGAVNGLDRPGAERTVDNVDTEGFTDVIVVADDRWHRTPWLLDEATFAMGDAEWVRQPAAGDEPPFIADIAGYVLAERYDTAVRTLVDLVDGGERIEAPPTPPDGAELDELLTPWIGLVGPDARGGAPAVVEGDADEATVTWEQTLTYEPDGADGRLAGQVTWRRSPAPEPDPPDPAAVIDLRDLADRLGEAG